MRIPVNYLVRRVRLDGSIVSFVLLVVSFGATVENGFPKAGIMFSIACLCVLLLCLHVHAFLRVEQGGNVTLTIQSWFKRHYIDVSSTSIIGMAGYSGLLMIGGSPTWTVIAIECANDLLPMNCTINLNPWTKRNLDRLVKQIADLNSTS